MLTTARPTSDPIVQAAAWVSTRGVQVEWRTTSSMELDRAAPDHPVLLLLEPGVRAPDRWGELEDWVRLPADSSEVYDRADRLIVRAAQAGAALTLVDDDDILRVGSRIIPLSPTEGTILRVLLAEAGRIVPRDRLDRKLWPETGPPEARALDNRVKRLRKRIVGVPLRIHTVRGRGFLLERTATLPPLTR